MLHLRLAHALLTISSPTNLPMSSSSQTLWSSSQFKLIFDVAVSEYKTRTGNNLINNLLAKELQSGESAEAVLNITQWEAKAFEKFRDSDKRLMKWIGPSVDVLYTISLILGAGVSIVRTIRDSLSCVTLKHRHGCTAVSCCKCGFCWNRASPQS